MAARPSSSVRFLVRVRVVLNFYQVLGRFTQAPQGPWICKGSRDLGLSLVALWRLLVGREGFN